MKRMRLPAVVLLICLLLCGCSAGKTEKNAADNPDLAPVSLVDLYNAGKLTWENDAVTVEVFEVPVEYEDEDAETEEVVIEGVEEEAFEFEGMEALDEAVEFEEEAEEVLIIEGNCAEVNGTRFTLADEFDFDTFTLQRIQVSGQAEESCVTKVAVYLDGAAKPVAEIELSTDAITSRNELVLEKKIRGKHKVSFAVCGYPKNGEEMTDGFVSACLTDIQFVAQTIPLLNLRIDESQGTIAAMNEDPSHTTKCYGALDIITAKGYRSEYNKKKASGTYELEYIKGRGNSTWGYGIHAPYKIKLQEAEDLFGMGANQHWALIANAFDKDMIRNPFTYKLGALLGLDFTPKYVCVDVMMNGEYLGNYILCENVRVDSSRVAIDDLDAETNEENITGGYLLGTAYYGADDDAYLFTTRYGQQFNVNSPVESEDPAYKAETEYIEQYMQRIENALYREPNPETGEVENPFDLMDLDSAVRYYWVQELSANGDFFATGSTYCYKVRDGKLFWGPLWDFDIAWATECMTDDIWASRRSWFQAMLTFEEFSDAAIAYYSDTLKPVMEDMLSETGFANSYYRAMEYSALNNSEIWGIVFEIDDRDTMRTQLTDSHTQFVENVTHRVQWCADNLDSLPAELVKVHFIVEGKTAVISIGLVDASIPVPEKPEIDGKHFIEWEYIGSDGEPYVFNEYVPIPADALEVIDGEKILRVYANMEDRDEAREIHAIRFQQPEYRLYLDPELFENWIYIPILMEPFDGYFDEIVWSVEEEGVIELVTSNDMIGICPIAEGSTRIIATLKDGSVIALPVTCTTPEEGEPSAYSVTDFRPETDALTMTVGETALVGIEVLAPEAYFNLADETCFEYEWTVVSGEACSVSVSGTITAEAAGTAVLSCRNTVTDVTRTITVTVK